MENTKVKLYSYDQLGWREQETAFENVMSKWNFEVEDTSVDSILELELSDCGSYKEHVEMQYGIIIDYDYSGIDYELNDHRDNISHITIDNAGISSEYVEKISLSDAHARLLLLLDKRSGLIEIALKEINEEETAIDEDYILNVMSYDCFDEWDLSDFWTVYKELKVNLTQAIGFIRDAVWSHLDYLSSGDYIEDQIKQLDMKFDKEGNVVEW